MKARQTALSELGLTAGDLLARWRTRRADQMSTTGVAHALEWEVGGGIVTVTRAHGQQPAGAVSASLEAWLVGRRIRVRCARSKVGTPLVLLLLDR